MRLFTSDESRSVDVGTGSIWYSIYSTAFIAFSDDAKKSIPLAMEFLKTGECAAENASATAGQLQSVKTAFASIEPEKAIYDLHKPSAPPPWNGNIAPTVTSCANLFTTADGKDLFTEVLSLLEYASNHNLPIYAG
jgi:hypothetical protein